MDKKIQRQAVSGYTSTHVGEASRWDQGPGEAPKASRRLRLRREVRGEGPGLSVDTAEGLGIGL